MSFFVDVTIGWDCGFDDDEKLLSNNRGQAFP